MIQFPFSDTVVIFDLDGTLVDSARDLGATLNHVLVAEGISPVSLHAIRPMVGHGALAMMQLGFEAAGRPFPDGAERDRLRDLFLDHYRGRIAAETIPFDGCVSCLDQLARSGATLAVCTNKYTDMAEALLTELGLRDRFALVFGRDAVAECKPSGLPLVEILRRTGKPLGLMVGDSYTDRDAARAAGIPVALATFGYGTLNEKLRSAEALFSHYDDLFSTLMTFKNAAEPG